LGIRTQQIFLLTAGVFEGKAMAESVYNIVKAPMGWSVFSDGVRLGGIYGSKEGALEAATVAASFAIRDGAGVQINVPGSTEPNEISVRWIKSVDQCA
jgi:hypothetical protein